MDMRVVLNCLAAGVLIGLPAVAMAQEWPDITGAWDTTFGPLNFTLKDIKDDAGAVIGKSATAPYKEEGGTVSGELQGSTLVGYWHEPYSSVKCTTKRANTFYWGKVEFVFNAAVNEYAGKWGYCEEAPERGWSGRRA